jgi:multicomponent Na+:H+ antiporter subunit D
VIIYLIIVPIIAGSVSIIFRNSRKLSISLLFLSLGTCGIFIPFLIGKEINYSLGNWGNLGISIGYDSLTLPFMLASLTIIGAVALNSLKKHYGGLFYGLLTLLYGSLNAVYVSRDLFNIYVTFELVSIIGFLLIAYQRKSKQIWASLKYMIIASMGFYVYLIAIGLVYYQTGSFAFESLNEVGSLIPALIFIGLSVKSGLFFVSMWLPDAHAGAPTEISPILSGIMVKVEDYLIIRFLLYDSFYWLSNVYLVIGSISAVIAVIFAMNTKKAKSILAYHTLSQVGFIVAASNIAGAWHGFSHAVFKGLLFMVVGNIYERLGTQDISKWKGKLLKKEYIPLFVGALAISGAPLTSGFVTKGRILESVPYFSDVLLIAASIGTVMSFSKFVFLGYSKQKSKQSWNVTTAYWILISIIFFHGIVGFDFHHFIEALIIIALGVFAYFVFRSSFKPLPRLLERLDNALGIYFAFIAIILTYLFFLP